MPRISENGVFISWPGPGMRPSAAKRAVETERLDGARRQPLLGEERLPGVDAQQERGPERQHHEHQQRRLQRAPRPRHEVGERIADRQAQHGRDRRVLEAREVGAKVQVVLQQEQVVARAWRLTASAPSFQATMSWIVVASISETLIRATTRNGSRKKTSSHRYGTRDDRRSRPRRARRVIASARPASASVQLAHAASPQVSGAPGWRSTLLWLTLRIRPLASCRW